MSFLKILIFSYLIILITSPPTTEVPKKEEVKNKGNYKSEEDEIKQMSDSFSTEWEKGMIDYDSDYVYLIPIAYKTNEVYYETISKVPARLRGAFILDENEDKKIELRIIGPDNKKVYSQASHMGIFDFNVTEKGLYEISFNNKFTNTEIKPTFTMNSGQNLKLEKQTLNKTESKLDDLIQFLQNYKTSDQMVRNMKRRRYTKLMETNKYFFIFSIIETLVLIAVSAWQYYYMKHLFEIKGSL